MADSDIHMELIAFLLGETQPSGELNRWLATPAGRAEHRAYRRALLILKRLYQGATMSEKMDFVHYSGMSTPVGHIWIASTRRGLARLAFEQTEEAFVEELGRHLQAFLVKSAESTSEIVRQLREYFAGERSSFDLPVDLSRLSGFQHRVLSAAREIPPGQVISYGELARRIGQPGASRAVGQALGRNPVPIVVPCHRIVREGGALGGYTGGLSIKKTLLRLEGALQA